MNTRKLKPIAAAGALAIALGLAACLETYPGTRIVYVESSPPPVRYEVVEVAPGPGFVWVSGYWYWSGVRYVWMSGRWERPPRGYRAWAPARWERHRNGWRFKQGHWRR